MKSCLAQLRDTSDEMVLNYFTYLFENQLYRVGKKTISEHKDINI